MANQSDQLLCDQLAAEAVHGLDRAVQSKLDFGLTLDECAELRRVIAPILSRAIKAGREENPE
jgi:hypothetical protein